MDRDDAGMSDRSDEARQGDTGMIGSESEEPGPGRDTSLTEPDPVAASTDQPRGTVAMSEGDPMRTRLGSHVEDVGPTSGSLFADEEVASERRSVFDTEDTGSADRSTIADHPAGLGAGDEPLDQDEEPGVQRGLYDQEADEARQRPSDGS
jgi:hypothetical protein